MSTPNNQIPVNKWLVTIAVMAGTFMEIVDTTVVNVALPHIAGSLVLGGRDHLDPDGLSGLQRSHPAHHRVAVGAVRPQALSDSLHSPVHRQFHVVRHGH